MAGAVSKMTVERPDERALEDRNVKDWPIWTKEPSTFDWHDEASETCDFLEGDVIVKTSQGDVRVGKGNLVTFPQGLDCTWDVKHAVRTHYQCG